MMVATETARVAATKTTRAMLTGQTRAQSASMSFLTRLGAHLANFSEEQPCASPSKAEGLPRQ
eukprot:6200016-Pleurochrysis_carterae.AAC.1